MSELREGFIDLLHDLPGALGQAALIGLFVVGVCAVAATVIGG